MKLIFPLLLGLFISYMVISLALHRNNYVLEIIRAIGQYLFPYLMPPAKHALALQNKVSKWQLIKKLHQIDYFKPFSAAEKAAFLDKLKACVDNEQEFEVELRGCLFALDKRSFLVDYYDGLVIDELGFIDKKEGLQARREHYDFNPFYNYLASLGLEVRLEISEETDANEEHYEMFHLTINGKVYKLCYEDDELFCNKLSAILNKALGEIGTAERLYVIHSYPTVLIFLTQKQYDYLNGLKLNNKK